MRTPETTTPRKLEFSYDPLAYFYNRYWGGDCLLFLPALEQLLLDTLPSGSRVVDLACGTGQLARTLADRGFAVTGVDSAAALLHYATTNAPNAEFVHSDIQEFTADTGFAAAVSVYDSLNHLLDTEQLRAAFQRTHDCLVPGGLFLFDVNDEHGYRQRWNSSFGITADDHAGVFRFAYDAAERLGTFTAALFTPEPEGTLWRRSDLALPQRCHPEEELIDTLHAVGFTLLQTRQAEEFGIENNAGRTFVLARRPS